VVDAFIDGEGPKTLQLIESSMTGDWVTDARNGTLSRVSRIAKLPGSVGQAFRTYRNMAQQRVEEAAAKLKHDCGQAH